MHVNQKSTCFYRTQTVEQARAEAEKIKLMGAAEAAAIEAVGKADAERMRLKASAYKQYGEAAMLNLVFETLPKVGNSTTSHLSIQSQNVLCISRHHSLFTK